MKAESRAIADTAPAAAAPDSTPARAERYVRLPLTVRRDHRDWSNAEQAAWVDMMLAAYEVRGRFESLELVRAYLGSRAGATDNIIARGDLVDDGEDGWIFLPYFDLYGEDGKLQRKSTADRLQDAADKMARGERLSDPEYAARYRAKRDNLPLPFPRQSDISSDNSDDAATTTTTTTKTTTTTNDEPVSLPSNDGGLVVDLYGQLFGSAPSSKKAAWLRNMAATYTERRTCHALSGEYNRDRNPATICGRMESGLKAGGAAS